MSRAPLEFVDPILSSDTAAISTPSHSQARGDFSPSRYARRSTSGSQVQDCIDHLNEREPLLSQSAQRKKKPFYRARPLWIVPFAMTAALVRAMTLAPRIEVFTQLACAQLHKHPFNHTLDPSQAFVRESLSFPTYATDSYINVISSEPSDNDDDGDDDPRRLPSSRCLTDAAVQAGAARLQTIMTTTMGFLSALTSGYWGHVGQRRGRLFVMAIATFGLFLTDLTFILVSTPTSPFSSHGHKLLILAPIIEGSLGGWSALQGATTAYISDCTSAGSRATIFSRFTGVTYAGFSLGPVIGGYIIRSGLGSQPGRGKSVTAVFWIAMFCSLVNFFLVLFVFPESLSKEKRAAAAEQYRREHSAKGKSRAVPPSLDESGDSNNDHDSSHAPVRSGIYGVAYKFLSPLGLFLPAVLTDVNSKKRKDWSLTFLGLGLFLYFLASGVYQIKYLYATHTFKWSAEQLSYYISGMGFTRAVFLLCILPFLIAMYKPKPKVTTDASEQNVSSKPGKPKLTKGHLAQEIRFDLLVARCSLFIDFMSNALVALVPAPTYTVHQLVYGTNSSSIGMNSQIFFVLASSLSGFGSGVVPAVQSLALCVVQARAMISGGTSAVDMAEGGTGKLLGALAVLQAIGQMIIGPMLFGLIYSGTVARFPKTIFITASGILTVALSCMFLVVSPLAKRASGKGKKRAAIEEVERGRSRASKDLFGAEGASHPYYSSY